MTSADAQAGIIDPLTGIVPYSRFSGMCRFWMRTRRDHEAGRVPVKRLKPMLMPCTCHGEKTQWSRIRLRPHLNQRRCCPLSDHSHASASAIPIKQSEVQGSCPPQ